MPINGKDLARIVDATNIKITATKADMERLIAEGIKHPHPLLTVFVEVIADLYQLSVFVGYRRFPLSVVCDFHVIRSSLP